MRKFIDKETLEDFCALISFAVLSVQHILLFLASNGVIDYIPLMITFVTYAVNAFKVKGKGCISFITIVSFVALLLWVFARMSIPAYDIGDNMNIIAAGDRVCNILVAVASLFVAILYIRKIRLPYADE